MPGCVSNTYHGYREELPRPTMETLLTQKPASLDYKNRFFQDNKKVLKEYVVLDHRMAQEEAEPEYHDKKELASKVTSRDFIKVQGPQTV